MVHCFLAVAYFICSFITFFLFITFYVNFLFILCLFYLVLSKSVYIFNDLCFCIFFIFKYNCVFFNFISLLSVNSFRYFFLTNLLNYLFLFLILLRLFLNNLFRRDSSRLMPFRESL